MATYQKILAKNPKDKEVLVYVNYGNLGSQMEMQEKQVKGVFSHILDTIVCL
jgi:hypothetical protein